MASPPSRFERFSQRISVEAAVRAAAGNPVSRYRFLYGPRESLNAFNGNVILGMNPGVEDEADRLWSPQTGYFSEAWPHSDYQERVRMLMQAAFSLAGSTDWKASWNRSLTSNLVPFRAVDVGDLGSRDLAFGMTLWLDIFREIVPRTIVTIGADTEKAIAKIVAQLGWKLEYLESFTDNGETANLYSIKLKKGESRLLAAPDFAGGRGIRDPRAMRAMADAIVPFLAI